MNLYKKARCNFGSYTLTDGSRNAVKSLNYRYSTYKNVVVRELDVTSLHFPFHDNAFDIVCSLGAMHHITHFSFVQHMANEMVRVSKKHLFLTEVNGISIIRRIGELSKKARNYVSPLMSHGNIKSFSLILVQEELKHPHF